MSTTYGRGLCSVCRDEFNLKKDGTVRWHGDGSFPPGMCAGAGRKPFGREGMSSSSPDADGVYRGVGGLAIQGALGANGPCVIGHWGRTGFGYSTASMREAAGAILAACDQADAMAGNRKELSS